MSGTPITVAETQEKIHRAKTRIGDTQAGYLEEKLVGSEYVNIVEEDGAVGKRLRFELDASSLNGVLDHTVKTSTSDSTAKYLKDKMEGDEFIGTAENGANPNKKVKVSFDLEGVSASQHLFTVKDVPLGACMFVREADEGVFGVDGFPLTNLLLVNVPTWNAEGNYGRGRGGSLSIASLPDGETPEFTAALCPISIDEDYDYTQGKIYVDVLFNCAAGVEANYIDKVRCQPVLFSGTVLLSALPYLPTPVDKDVENDIADGYARKITYEITIASPVPSGKWLSGWLFFTCGTTDVTAVGANIAGVRVRYKRKTLGLRSGDVS